MKTMSEKKEAAHWISVKDALPPAYTTVIVCRISLLGKIVVESGQLTYDNWWWVYGSRTKNVTHWMPVPQPPKEVSSRD